LLEFAEQVIRLSLALWVGGTLLVAIAAPVLFRGLPSRDQAGDIFDEILRRFEAVKHVLSLLLVIAVFLELERRGRLEGTGIASGIATFLAVASNVYLALVLRPRMKYFRMKVGSFDAAEPDNPWKTKFDRLHRRSVRVLLLGAIAAAAALALRP
jgi:Domain of unknown function (DUF4149)